VKAIRSKSDILLKMDDPAETDNKTGSIQNMLVIEKTR
jgi:hypothetical protein